MTDQTMSGAQPESNGVTPENQPIKKVNSPDNDYKRDMLKFKDKAAELENRLKQYELKEEEAKGNLQAVIQKLKDENRELKQTHAQSKVMFAEGKLEESIKSLASQKGCKDVDTFYKLIDKTDLEIVSLDDKFNANKEDIQSLVENYSKKYEHLGFFADKVKIVDKTPNAKPINQPVKTKALTEMSKEELLELAAKQGMKRII
jgi:hypothetical protein